MNALTRRRPLDSLVATLVAAVVPSLVLTAPCAAQSAGGRISPSFPAGVRPNHRVMPAYQYTLSQGKNKLTVKNPYHFKVMAQVRSGNKGKDFALEGKKSLVLWIPDGEYTLFWRGYNDTAVYEGRSFTASGGAIAFDEEDDGPDKPDDPFSKPKKKK